MGSLLPYPPSALTLERCYLLIQRLQSTRQSKIQEVDTKPSVLCTYLCSHTDSPGLAMALNLTCKPEIWQKPLHVWSVCELGTFSSSPVLRACVTLPVLSLRTRRYASQCPSASCSPRLWAWSSPLLSWVRRSLRCWLSRNDTSLPCCNFFLNWDSFWDCSWIKILDSLRWNTEIM
jgi:hypothetical protein